MRLTPFLLLPVELLDVFEAALDLVGGVGNLVGVVDDAVEYTENRIRRGTLNYHSPFQEGYRQMQAAQEARKQILVVEDEGLIADDIQRRLERLGSSERAKEAR